MERVLVTILTVALLTELVSSVTIKGPEDELIEDRSSANLTCGGTSTIATVEWMKDDQVLSPSDRVEFSEDSTSVLISPVKRTDSGEYRCTTNDSLSLDTALLNLTVYYGPDVRILGVASVEEGSDVLLFCSTESLPAASVTWTVNGATAGHSPLLIIENSNHTHSGTYNCTAFNNVTGNTASAVLVLSVTGKVRGPVLGPGEAAGITVAVIVLVAGLAVGLYFLIVHLKNSPGPLCKIPKPKRNKENRTEENRYTEEDDNNALKTTTFKTNQQTTSQDTPGTQSERPRPHLYENLENKPPVPRHAKPSQLPDRVVDTSPPALPARVINTKPPKVLDREDAKPPKVLDREDAKPPKVLDRQDAALANRRRSLSLEGPSLPPRPDHLFKTDSKLYSTQLP